MASLDHRLNPLFSIKECMTCGALYTADFCCSKGGLEDKILVPKPPQNYATYGNPVDGLYCRSCAFVRKCLNEGWYTIHDENEILNTSESSNHNTNIVSAPREPFVFNQDPSVNFSQSPPQIYNNCCYECGDSLDGIFCQQCNFKYCGKGAHYGYNCPPQIPIISNPEQCNQNIDELPQTLPSVHSTCNSEDKNSFTYDSKPNFVDSPNVFNPPPQPSMYSCGFCGNDARYGHYLESFRFSTSMWYTYYLDKAKEITSDILITSPKIDFLPEEFTGEFAHIPPGMDKDEFDEEEVDCYDHDISNVILREKLLNVHRLITNIESLKNNSTPDYVLKSPISVTDSGSFFEEFDTFLSHLDNSLPEFETFSDHTEETGSGLSTTTSCSITLFSSTDKAKITRKRSKMDKHGHENGRARKEPGECYQ
ncbi:hypothetical protein Tco_1192814 [Tanacetum coccineum]